jgi:large subunit ribosomal protein L1
MVKKLEANEEDTDKKIDSVSTVEKNDENTSEKPLAKAGKRSAKVIAEKEKIETKKLKKQEGTSEEVVKPKVKQNPPKSKLERKGKNYRNKYSLIDKTKEYSLEDAIDLLIKTSPSKFDATAELHIRLGVDPKHADQNIRDSIILPSGTGRTLKIAVFADDKELASAKAAGADIALGEPFLEQLDKGLIDFDLLIATPAMMPKLGKYARLLGPKGLMPNPKNGSVAADVAKAVKEAKTGKVEYKIDSAGIVHLGFGKVSFGKNGLVKNAETVLNSIKSNKPSSLKGNYVLSVFVTSTMGPSIKVTKNL